ncbi:MAG: ROK family protein [Anaerolineae bacterium]|nr:ROK family protein [Anaerolineae bacterium]
MEILGVDIGGSGIKGAVVDTKTGELVRPRFRIPTPNPSKPKAVARVVKQLTKHFDWSGTIGVGFPAPVQRGVTLTAANVDDRWIGANAAKLFSEVTGCPVFVINDADAAGLAEMRFGAGRGRMGVVLIVTVGTGLGTALFIDGHLLPNTELGHIEIRGKDAETRASDAARKALDLSWADWTPLFNEYLLTLERLFWPDLIILGGGASKKTEKFLHHLTVTTEVVPAQMLNQAGIVGAALAAELALQRS